MKIKTIILDTKYCYPCFPILENEFLYIGLRFTDSNAAINTSTTYIFQKRNIELNQIIWTFDLNINTLLCKPILFKNIVLLSTENGLFAIDKLNGKIIWKLKSKISNSHLSIIENKIYLTNKNSIEVINPETGKREMQKKYRIKWIDSQVVIYKEKLFVSTSNSKIIEINKKNLEILKEFKYPGGWAIGTTPEFYKNQIISNSYASYITSFDIDSGEIIWRIKKNAGSEPKQLKISEFIYAIEILGVYKLTSINLEKGKKVWSKDYHIHELAEFKDGTLLATLKQKNNQFCIGLINAENGDLTSLVNSNDFIFDEKFQYRLWREATIESDKNKSIVCFKPCEVTLIDK